MSGDIYTKAFTDPDKYQKVCDLINVADPARLEKLVAGHLARYEKSSKPADATLAPICETCCEDWKGVRERV